MERVIAGSIPNPVLLLLLLLVLRPLLVVELSGWRGVSSWTSCHSPPRSHPEMPYTVQGTAATLDGAGNTLLRMTTARTNGIAAYTSRLGHDCVTSLCSRSSWRLRITTSVLPRHLPSALLFSVSIIIHSYCVTLTHQPGGMYNTWLCLIRLPFISLPLLMSTRTVDRGFGRPLGIVLASFSLIRFITRATSLGSAVCANLRCCWTIIRESYVFDEPGCCPFYEVVSVVDWVRSSSRRCKSYAFKVTEKNSVWW